MARSVNFGLWYDFRNPGHQVSFEKLYRDSLDQIAWAETIGFDSVWLTEHHFVQDGYCPSPLVVAAAIGQHQLAAVIAFYSHHTFKLTPHDVQALVGNGTVVVV